MKSRQESVRMICQEGGGINWHDTDEGATSCLPKTCAWYLCLKKGDCCLLLEYSNVSNHGWSVLI